VIHRFTVTGVVRRRAWKVLPVHRATFVWRASFRRRSQTRACDVARSRRVVLEIDADTFLPGERLFGCSYDPTTRSAQDVEGHIGALSIRFAHIGCAAAPSFDRYRSCPRRAEAPKLRTAAEHGCRLGRVRLPIIDILGFALRGGDATRSSSSVLIRLRATGLYQSAL
jgi:hypothetical protein